MKGRILAAAAMVAATAASAHAQVGSCPAGGDPNTVSGGSANVVRDACIMGSDVFQFLGPQLGLALAGGNATLGQGGTLGGFPHFVVGIRGNVLVGDLPDFADFPAPRNTQDPETQPRTLPSSNTALGLPVVDAAIGVFKGFPLGLTNVGGVDLLISAAYVPQVGSDEDDFRIDPEEPLQLGFGARVGLLQESLLAPGVSFTFIQRNLPETDIFGRTPPDALGQSELEIDIQNASIKTNAWRLVASKSLLVFGLALGVGQDKYDLSTTLNGRARVTTVAGGLPLVVDESFENIEFSQKMTRTNMFLDASMNLPFIRIVGEIGRATGGDVTDMVNTFSGGDANQSRVYGSLGVRFGL